MKSNNLYINNSNNNIFNKTSNINILRFDDEDIIIDFDINHIEYNFIDKLYKIDVEKAYRLFYKKLFENKHNQNIIKINLKQFFTDGYTSSIVWKQIMYNNIYIILLYYISETFLTYIYDNTKNKEDNKYKELKEYANIMSENKFYNNITDEIEKSYKNHIKSLKILFSKFKDD